MHVYMYLDVYTYECVLDNYIKEAIAWVLDRCSILCNYLNVLAASIQTRNVLHPQECVLAVHYLECAPRTHTCASVINITLLFT